MCIGPIYVDINCIGFPCDGGLPPEKEIRGEAYEVVPGGSAVNFARFARQLGLGTVLGGRVGEDKLGRAALSLLRESGVELSVVADKTALTDVGINFVSPSGTSVMAVVGTASSTMTARTLHDCIDGQTAPFDYLYLGGSFKTPHLLGEMKELAAAVRRRGVKVVLDHGHIPVGTSEDTLSSARALASAADIYLPSRREFLELWHADSIEEAAYRASRSADRDTAGDRVIAIKNGAAGVTAFAGGIAISREAYEADASNTVGAGDSFNAGFIAAESLGFDLRDKLDFACAAAAVKISGATLPTRDAVERIYSQGSKRAFAQ